MQPIIITQSRKRWLIYFLGACVFVATGILLLLNGESGIVAWMTIVFFGGCALMFLWQFLDNRPRITISDLGIEDRFLKIGLIQWADIAAIKLWRQQGNPYLGLELYDEQKYVGRLSPLMQRMVVLNVKLGFPGLSLNLAGTDAIPEQVEALLVQELHVRFPDRAV